VNPLDSKRSSTSMTNLRADASLATKQPFVISIAVDGVATLTLNRPERFNPLSVEMIAAVRTALDAIAGDPSVRVVILAAEGKGFCAGHDLNELRAHSDDKEWQQDLFDACSRMMIALTEIPQPVIARVHGIATAAGCQLVSMCDLAVAADSATFAMPGVNIGVFCSTPAVGVVRNIGRKRAMEMLLTGEPIDASTALSWGLVNRVVQTSRLDAEIRRLTDVVLSQSSAAISLGKQSFYRQIDCPLGAAYDVASDVMARNMLLEDAAEGIDAFLQKRPANWRGR
jgi:enoyl-CoA hydratase/carnithine racemase